MATRPTRTRPFRWTRAHLARLPDDGNRYEVLDGALLVTPQARPRHQIIATRLARLLAEYCDAHWPATVVGPGAVVWKRNELQPDVEVIPGVQDAAGDPDWTDVPLPVLVVEILSPGSERHDRYRKRDAYLALGIPEYWIVDIDKRLVLVSRPGEESRTVTDALIWRPMAHVDPLALDVATLVQ